MPSRPDLVGSVSVEWVGVGRVDSIVRRSHQGYGVYQAQAPWPFGVE